MVQPDLKMLFLLTGSVSFPDDAKGINNVYIEPEK